MQNNINNNERDAFSDLFREKLKNHKVPVDAISWDEITGLVTLEDLMRENKALKPDLTGLKR